MPDFAGFQAPKNSLKELKLILRHTSKEVQVLVSEVKYKIDVNTLRKNEEDNELGMNDIGRISLRASQPVFGIPTEEIGIQEFHLVDPFTNETLAAGDAEVISLSFRESY